MKLLHLRMDTLFLRFYLMMAIVLIAGFTGIWAIAFLALPVFLSCLMGVRFGSAETTQRTGMFKELNTRQEHPATVAKQTAA